MSLSPVTPGDLRTKATLSKRVELNLGGSALSPLRRSPAPHTKAATVTTPALLPPPGPLQGGGSTRRAGRVASGEATPSDPQTWPAWPGAVAE